jgi:hypothetical protein
MTSDQLYGEALAIKEGSLCRNVVRVILEAKDAADTLGDDSPAAAEPERYEANVMEALALNLFSEPEEVQAWYRARGVLARRDPAPSA